jgi:hypothetical protein
MIEFGLIFSALVLVTVGLVDVGRAFYEYNEVSALARYGSRWAAVVGGTCSINGGSYSDWCNSSGTTAAAAGFWNTPGNAPLQGVDVACPSYSSAPYDYYSVQSYANTTTIIGALAQRWDTTPRSYSQSDGNSGPGLDRSLVSVCIATTNTGTGTDKTPQLGDGVTITIRYPFKAVSGIFGKNLQIELSATSISRVE